MIYSLKINLLSGQLQLQQQQISSTNTTIRNNGSKANSTFRGGVGLNASTSSTGGDHGDALVDGNPFENNTSVNISVPQGDAVFLKVPHLKKHRNYKLKMNQLCTNPVFDLQ
jgi:hypothetical protein